MSDEKNFASCHRAWLHVVAGVLCLLGCAATEAQPRSVSTVALALSAGDFFITEVAQKTSYDGSTADKVEVYCDAGDGCPAYRVCDATSSGGKSCSSEQAPLSSGERRVVSRGANITTDVEEAIWLEDCTNDCSEIAGTRVQGPFPCADGQSVARRDCSTAAFAACAPPGLGEGEACTDSCGDSTCSASESCASCAADCGVCGEAFAYSIAFAQDQHGAASSECSGALCSQLEALIDGATTSIDFAIYGVRGQQAIIDALASAESRGVRVRGVVDSENDACGVQGQYTYPDTPALFTQLKPGAVVCDNGSGFGYIMHNKFFVVDGRRVWTGSTNVSDTGTGGELNANVVVTIESAALASIYTTEFEEMYSGACHNQKTDNTIHVLGPTSWADGSTVVESYFAPTDDAATNAILRMINQATTSVDVAIFYLTHAGIGDALVAAHARGVAVRIILDANGASSQGSQKDKLCSAGLPLKVENWPGKQHGKWAVADGRVVVFGSQNWTAAGNDKNDENTLYVENAAFAAEFVNEFADQWADLSAVGNCAATRAEGTSSPGTCSDGNDNDHDSNIDCADADCSTDPACSASAEGSAAVCGDGLDNDADGYFDCDDFDCSGLGVCALLVNECLPEPRPGSEWIELYNPTAGAVDASGSFVDDKSGGSSPSRLPIGTVVPARGTLVIPLRGRMLNNDGDDACRLLDPQRREIDSIAYTDAPPNQSFARGPNASGTLSWDSTPTPGAVNQ